MSRSDFHRRVLRGLSTLCLIVTSADLQAQGYTDVLFLRNGDRITGNIKSLSRGRLEYSTDNSRRMSLEWLKVARIESPKQFEFRLASSRKYLGRISFAEDDGFGMILTRSDTVSLGLPQIVEIHPIGETFLNRLSGSFDLGFDFTRANKQSIWNLRADVAYQSEHWVSRTDVDSYLNFQDSVNTVTRNSISLSSQRLLGKGFATGAEVRAEENQELNLDYRVSLTAQMGLIVFRSNTDRLETRAGLSATRERFTGNKPALNLEGTVTGQYDFFKFGDPDLDARVIAELFPSISDPGRLRFNGRGSVKWEVIADLYLGVNTFLIVDSRPGIGAEKVDYGFGTTVGYTFRR